MKKEKELERPPPSDNQVRAEFDPFLSTCASTTLTYPVSTGFDLLTRDGCHDNRHGVDKVKDYESMRFLSGATVLDENTDDVKEKVSQKLSNNQETKLFSKRDMITNDDVSDGTVKNPEIKDDKNVSSFKTLKSIDDKVEELKSWKEDTNTTEKLKSVQSLITKAEIHSEIKKTQSYHNQMKELMNLRNKQSEEKTDPPKEDRKKENKRTDSEIREWAFDDEKAKFERIKDLLHGPDEKSTDVEKRGDDSLTVEITSEKGKMEEEFMDNKDMEEYVKRKHTACVDVNEQTSCKSELDPDTHKPSEKVEQELSETPDDDEGETHKSVTEHSLKSVTEPSFESVTDFSCESVTDLSGASASEHSCENVSESSFGSVTQPFLESVTGFSGESVSWHSGATATEHSCESVTEPVFESVTENSWPYDILDMSSSCKTSLENLDDVAGIESTGPLNQDGVQDLVKDREEIDWKKTPKLDGLSLLFDSLLRVCKEWFKVSTDRNEKNCQCVNDLRVKMLSITEQFFESKHKGQTAMQWVGNEDDTLSDKEIQNAKMCEKDGVEIETENDLDETKIRTDNGMNEKDQPRALNHEMNDEEVISIESDEQRAADGGDNKVVGHDSTANIPTVTVKQLADHDVNVEEVLDKEGDEKKSTDNGDIKAKEGDSNAKVVEKDCAQLECDDQKASKEGNEIKAERKGSKTGSERHLDFAKIEMEQNRTYQTDCFPDICNGSNCNPQCAINAIIIDNYDCMEDQSEWKENVGSQKNNVAKVMKINTHICNEVKEFTKCTDVSADSPSTKKRGRNKRNKKKKSNDHKDFNLDDLLMKETENDTVLFTPTKKGLEGKPQPTKSFNSCLKPKRKHPLPTLPKSNKDNCDIFIPKTCKGQRRHKMLHLPPKGRTCSDSSTGAGGSPKGVGNTEKGKQGNGNEDQNNNNDPDENKGNDRKNGGNPNDGDSPGNGFLPSSNPMPRTSLTDVNLPKRDFKGYRKKHSDISVEYWEKFLGFLKEQTEARECPYWDLDPNPVAPCLALSMSQLEDLPDDMLECVVCSTINSLLKHYANCNSAYIACDICSQIFSLICCHVNECTRRNASFNHGSLPSITSCDIALCMKIRLTIVGSDIAAHLKMLWFNVRKKLSRVMGEIEDVHQERRGSVVSMPPSLESIPENEVPPVTQSRPTSRVLSRKRSKLLADVAEKDESIVTEGGVTEAHGELNDVAPDAVPESIETKKKVGGAGFMSMPMGPPGGFDLQFQSFTDRPVGIKGIGEVVYGVKPQLIVVAQHWDKKKKEYMETGKLPTHYREEGVILEKYRDILLLGGTRYQKDFQWVRVSALGNGMSGKCSLGMDFQTEAKFCVKEIHISCYEMDEIKLWLDLDHPYIVQIYGAIRYGERIFIFMEYIEGGCLTEMINHQRQLGQRLSQATALRYFQQLLQVLCHLKSKHILHEDLKGDNILLHKVDKSVSIKVTDFGAARRCDGQVRKGTKPVGTQTQWSPEKAEATGYSFPAELWAAVCVLIHMLSGSPPWIQRFETFKTLIVVIVKYSPPLEDIPKNISSSVRDLIERGLTVCPGTRPTPEQLLAHHAFNILDNSTNTEKYSILPSGFGSTSCIEDDLTKDLREIYRNLGGTSPDRKLQFIQPSHSVQVYTVHENNTHRAANQVGAVGGATNNVGGATNHMGGASNLSGGAVGQDRGASAAAEQSTEQEVDMTQNAGKENLKRKNSPSDPNKNLDPTEHFKNFLSDTTPPGIPVEPDDTLMMYYPDLVVREEPEQPTNFLNQRIDSNDALAGMIPNFDKLFGSEEREEGFYQEDNSDEEKADDIFRDFNLNDALLKLNLTDENESMRKDSDEKDKNSSSIFDNQEKRKPVLPEPHDATQYSFNEDDLFKSGSPTTGHFDFGTSSVNDPTSQPSNENVTSIVQGQGQTQHFSEAGQYFLTTTPQHTSNRATQPTGPRGPPSYVQSPNMPLQRLQVQPPRGGQIIGTRPNQQYQYPIYPSPDQTIRVQIPINQTSPDLGQGFTGYPHSLSPNQRQAQSMQFHYQPPGSFYNRPGYSTYSYQDQGHDPQWAAAVQHRMEYARFQPFISPQPQSYAGYSQTRGVYTPGGNNTTGYTWEMPQTRHPSSAPPRYDPNAANVQPYGHVDNPGRLTNYIPQQMLSSTPIHPGVKPAHLQLDVEKANLEKPVPSTYAQTAPVVSPPKTPKLTSPSYKRAVSYVTPKPPKLSFSTPSPGDRSMTPKSQLEEQERALIEFGDTAREALSQHEGSVLDFEEDDEQKMDVPPEIDLTGELTLNDWESMAVYLGDPEKDPSRIEVTFKRRMDPDWKGIKMSFPRSSKEKTWEIIFEEELERHSNEISAGLERFCLRLEDGSLLDVENSLGEDDIVVYVEPADDRDWWWVEKGMIMKSHNRS